jgi:vacuolar-type H+-ATPase subunit I/STV1
MDFMDVVEDTGLSISDARIRLEAHEAKLGALAEHLDGLPVTTDDECSDVLGQTGEATDLLKKVEAERVRLVKPANEYTKAVNATARKMSEKLKDAVEGAKHRIGQFRHRQELERRKAEEAIKKASEKLQKELDEEAKKSGVEAPTVTPAPLPKKRKVAVSETGATAHTRKVWKYKVIDEGKVPRQYCTPDGKKINAAIKGGMREIEGLEIWEDVTTVLKT